MGLAEDQLNRRVRPSAIFGLVWESEYQPWTAQEGLTCVRCHERILKYGLAWYRDQAGPYCTRCRNAGLSKDRDGIGG